MELEKLGAIRLVDRTVFLSNEVSILLARIGASKVTDNQRRKIENVLYKMNTELSSMISSLIEIE